MVIMSKILIGGLYIGKSPSPREILADVICGKNMKRGRAKGGKCKRKRKKREVKRKKGEREKRRGEVKG
jgi:hypothetical protein